MARTPDKKTWISWKISKRKEIGDQRIVAVRTYLQLLDKDGVPQFEEPILVNDHATPTWWSTYSLCVASDGSAIVTVADSRTEESGLTEDGDSPQTFTPAIYKVSQEGDFLWGLDGIEYTQYHNAPYTYAQVVGDDTYFVFRNTNEESTVDYDDPTVGTFIQRINDDGTVAWETPRQWSADMVNTQMLPTLNNEFLLFDGCPEGGRVHRLNRDLEEVWGDPVVYDEYKYDGYELNPYKIVSDGNGGACVTYTRNMGDFSHNIRVQHINEDGSLGFGLSGLDAYNQDAYDHNYPSIAVNPETEQIFVMYASQLASTGNVNAQLFTFDGDYLFPETGLSLASKSTATNTYFYGLAGCGSLKGGDWIVVYRDLAGWGKSSFIIRRYDSTGKRVWTKTIGRDLNPTDVRLVVEEEATYLFYREESSEKNPGINIFRIGNDGTYNVSYDTGIQENIRESAGKNRYYSLDGKQLSTLQKGLNLVRKADGTVQKYISNK